MPLTYSKTSEADSLIDSLVQKHYPDLAEAEVTFEVLECMGGLKFHGHPAAAVVKIISLKDRVAGLADVRIILDRDEWTAMDKKRRTALIDAKLHEIEVKREDEIGEITSDDIGRAKLKLRKHDIVVNGFQAIIERHKEYAFEAQQFAYQAEKLKQLEFDWDKAALMAAHGSDGKAEEKEAA